MANIYKFAFIFLDEIHHINHFITVAIELSKVHEVSILTYPGKHVYLRKSLKKLHGEKIHLKELKTLPFRAFTDTLKNRELPRKGFWMKKNKKYILNNFDAVVFTDYIHHKLLKARENRPFPKFIKFEHGMAGRSYSYKKDLLDFDLHVIYGEFYRKQLKKRKLLIKNAVIGYPKLEAIKIHQEKKIFNNQKPVVLYNPHFSPPHSSWHKEGLKILEYFFNQKEYNLIFAPHLHLFQKLKGGVEETELPQKYFEAPHIYIDLGSEESVNMTYVQNADIYLGDVSSQVYEFIINPRPCIFLNPENIDYRDNPDFRFWKCGNVIKGAKELENSLNEARSKFEEEHKKIQQKITSQNFYTEENSTASERAANAIVRFLNEA